MSDFKTNYFGSFLDAMNTPSSSGVAAPSAAKPVTSSAADAVLQTLSNHQGTAAVNDLLPHTGFSVDGLIEVIDRLVSFGFVQRDGATVTLTAAGKQVAARRP